MLVGQFRSAELRWLRWAARIILRLRQYRARTHVRYVTRAARDCSNAPLVLIDLRHPEG
jgi:hypothetical protein